MYVLILVLQMMELRLKEVTKSVDEHTQENNVSLKTLCFFHYSIILKNYFKSHALHDCGSDL